MEMLVLLELVKHQVNREPQVLQVLQDLQVIQEQMD